jgi:NAD(P)-dependent dehydrogenase (short-subunit alcohol dehydrogenase family)
MEKLHGEVAKYGSWLIIRLLMSVVKIACYLDSPCINPMYNEICNLEVHITNRRLQRRIILMRLNGKNAIITGGGSGISQAISLGFAREGAGLVVADINKENAESTAEAIRSAGGKAIAVAVDVSSASQVKAMMEKAVETFGRIHILVSGAGVSSCYNFIDLPEDEWDRVININLKGLYLCGQAAARHMAKHGGGVIINVTSQVSEVAQRNFPHYQASKGGGRMLTKSMAVDLANFNIRVNALAPGFTDTPLTSQSYVYSTEEELAAQMESLLQHIPLGRAAKPEDMVGAAIFLASDESAYVTGTSLFVDGGYLAI